MVVVNLVGLVFEDCEGCGGDEQCCYKRQQPHRIHVDSMRGFASYAELEMEM
jgi:hypothetical protein